MGPCMVRESGALSRSFDISYMLFSAGVQRSASFTHVTPQLTPRTIGAMNFCKQRLFENSEKDETSGP